MPNGNIEFLGRVDEQVKIRGFRIELGEIKAKLSEHPAVHEAEVIVKEDELGNKYLVAYVIPQKEHFNLSHIREYQQISQNSNTDINHQSNNLTISLKSYLKKLLPEYMVPNILMLLDSLPITANGKVDRHALPDPDKVRSELQQTFVAPRDTLELKLVHIWQDILGIQPIGINDNFFNLGGHSLVAVRLMAQVHEKFAQNMPLTTLFQAPTIEQMAIALREPMLSQPWSPLVKIQPNGSKRPFFCLPGTGGNVMYLYHLARHFGSEQPFYALQARGLDGVQIPHARIEDMASDYIAAIQTIQPQGPYLLGGHSFGSFVAFEMALQLQKQGQEIATLVIFDTPAPTPENRPVEHEQDDTK